LKFTCIIVDDEPLSVSILEKYCAKNAFLALVGTFNNPTDALLFLKHHAVDIIFLDIIMPKTNGFELLDNLHYLPNVILTSSSTEFAYTAYQYHVKDYLKKPFSYSRFIESINNLSVNNHNQSFDIKSRTSYFKLLKKDILYIESTGDYLQYVTVDKTYPVLNTLKNIEEKMDTTMFIKVHRSYLINMHKITNITDNKVIINHVEIPISKTYKNHLLATIAALV
jgi:DNA-binding LytR/AlgR family response regulator